MSGTRRARAGWVRLPRLLAGRATEGRATSVAPLLLLEPVGLELGPTAWLALGVAWPGVAESSTWDASEASGPLVAVVKVSM